MPLTPPPACHPPAPTRLLTSEQGVADPSLMFPLGVADPALCTFLHDAFSLYFAAIPNYQNISSAGYGAGTIIPSECIAEGGGGGVLGERKVALRLLYRQHAQAWWLAAVSTQRCRWSCGCIKVPRYRHHICRPCASHPCPPASRTKIPQAPWRRWSLPR